MDNSDFFLFSKVASGNIKAFESFFKRYYPKVKAMLCAMIKDEYMAENIAQDLFVNIWIDKEKLLNINSPDSYLFICTRNAAIQHLKKKKITDGFNISEVYGIGENYTEEEVFLEELQTIISEEIEKMPPQRHQVFVMSRFQGKSTKQIALELNISPRTVEKHLSAALKTLRKIEYYLLVLLISVN